jgi:hypothetical protein
MKHLEQFIAAHAVEIEALKTQLATNYDVPAQRLINAVFAKMGVDRFDRDGDVWEQVVCFQNGWEYEAPSAELQQRWARY